MYQLNGKAEISTLPTFLTDHSKTLNQERYPVYDSTRKIWLTWNNVTMTTQEVH